MKREGLPQHVQEAIDKATPEQLAGMLKVGSSKGYQRPKAGKSTARPPAVSEKRAELLAMRREWAQVLKVWYTGPGGVKLVLPYPVSANQYWRSRVVVPKGNPRAAFVNTYVSEEAKLYKEMIAGFARERGLVPLIGELEVRIALYRPQRSGDLDNRIKVMLDALREILYADDNVITKIVAERHEDKTNPRAEVEVLQRTADLFQGNDVLWGGQ